ncbi:hypothetical protein [Streptomyces sp. NPDC057287]|uniref:hypothetical protein n=1 Tax=Streptomyces sp. NPDC057287 TaxID=3346086 RepID=UPI0036250F21
MTSAALRSRAWKLLEMVTTPLPPSDYTPAAGPEHPVGSGDVRGPARVDSPGP